MKKYNVQLQSKKEELEQQKSQYEVNQLAPFTL